MNNLNNIKHIIINLLIKKDILEEFINIINNKEYYKYTKKRTWLDNNKFDYKSMLVKNVR